MDVGLVTKILLDGKLSVICKQSHSFNCQTTAFQQILENGWDCRWIASRRSRSSGVGLHGCWAVGDFLVTRGIPLKMCGMRGDSIVSKLDGCRVGCNIVPIRLNELAS